MKLRIKKGATVEVISGSDKGKKGQVLEIKPLTMQIKVQGIRMQSKHTKKEGVLVREGFIHYSNVKSLETARSSAQKKAKK